MRRKWTEPERLRLAWMWGQEAPCAVAEELGRSENAVKVMAKRMGMRLRNDDRISVEAAAERLGVAPPVVKRVCKEMRVMLKVVPSARGGAVLRHRRLSFEALRKAYLQWLERRTMSEWGAEFGLSSSTTCRAAARAGVKGWAKVERREAAEVMLAYLENAGPGRRPSEAFIGLEALWAMAVEKPKRSARAKR